MTNQNAIQIHLGPQGWLGTFTGPHAKRIGELFDTCTLPLPYTSAMPLGTVIAEVQARNPGVSVFHFASRSAAHA
jgi:hypothetical protein